MALTAIDVGLKSLHAFQSLRLVRDGECGVDIQGLVPRTLHWMVVWTFPEK